MTDTNATDNSSQAGVVTGSEDVLSGSSSFFDLGKNEATMKSEIKSRIVQNLKKMNEKSKIYEDLIKDYLTLFKKYLNTKEFLKTEAKVAVSSEGYAKMKQEDLIKLLEAEKQKQAHQETENMQNKNQLISRLSEITQLKDDIYKLEKLNEKLAPLKDKNEALEERVKELSILSKNLEKENKSLQQEKKNLITQVKDLSESLNKTVLQNRLLHAKVASLQEEAMDQKNTLLEKLQSAEQQKSAAEKYFKEKEKDYNDSVKNVPVPDFMTSVEEVKVPKKLKLKQKFHNRAITSIYFNSFGNSFITTSADYFIKVYDAGKNLETGIFSGFASSVSAACFDHTEQFLFAGSLDKTAKLWSLKNNKLITTYTGHIDYINCVKTFNSQPHGLTGSTDRTIREWDFNTKNSVRKFNCISDCRTIAIAPDDTFILSGHADGCVRLWANNDKPEQTFDLHDDKVLQLEILKNEMQILSLSEDNTIKLFDLKKNESVYTLNANNIPQYCESSIGISSDRKYFAVGSTKGTIYIVNMKDGSIDSTIVNKGNPTITSLRWRPFNSQIYVGDSNGYLSIWGTTGK